MRADEMRRRNAEDPRLRAMREELKKEVKERDNNRSHAWRWNTQENYALVNVFWPGKMSAVTLLVQPLKDEEGGYCFEASINRQGMQGMNDHGPGNHPTAKEALDAIEWYVVTLFRGRIANEKVREEKERWEAAILRTFDGDSDLLAQIKEMMWEMHLEANKGGDE